MFSSFVGVLGSVLAAIGTPILAFLTYMAVFSSYRSEKRMIVQQVKQNLRIEQIAQPFNLYQIAAAKDVAAAVTLDCLKRWDGFLALRAKVDSNGKRSGIWMDRFETVRFASMLLAMKKINDKLQRRSSGKCTTIAWCKWHL